MCVPFATADRLAQLAPSPARDHQRDADRQPGEADGDPTWIAGHEAARRERHVEPLEDEEDSRRGQHQTDDHQRDAHETSIAAEDESQTVEG